MSNHETTPNRRQFLQLTGAAGLAAVVGSNLLGPPATQAGTSATARQPEGPGAPRAAGPYNPNTPVVLQADQSSTTRGPTDAPLDERLFDFNVFTDVLYQNNDWSCSVNSGLWMLQTLGLDVTWQQLKDIMVPRYATPEQGLLTADGSNLALVLRRHFDLPAFSKGVVDWGELTAMAGTRPMAIGGRRWYHYVGVRRVLETGNLHLANPAPGYVPFGERVYQVMDRKDFDNLGAFCAVWVDVEG
jgi:hypothetical protein